MAHTNSTTNYGLPQWIGSDKPTFLGDFNSAFNTIDTQMKSNETTATGAAETASSANATAISANETAVAADGKATLAKNTADAATSAAQSASDLATVAKNTADSAARTAQANNIANLAPAYDETLTYNVGDLVTYVDENNSGKLYKCIVAWVTPGAFNINYWDDVTASSIFLRDWVEIAQIDCLSRVPRQAMVDVYNLIDSKIDLEDPAAPSKFMIIIQEEGRTGPNYFTLKDGNIDTSNESISFGLTYGWWVAANLNGEIISRLWTFSADINDCSDIGMKHRGTNFVKNSENRYTTDTVQQSMSERTEAVDYKPLFRVFIRN